MESWWALQWGWLLDFQLGLQWALLLESLWALQWGILWESWWERKWGLQLVQMLGLLKGQMLELQLVSWSDFQWGQMWVFQLVER